MATLVATIKSTLSGDSTLSALLTGGILDSSDLPEEDGGAGDIPYDTDGVTILPFAVLRWKDSVAVGLHHTGQENASLEIYIYEWVGYDTIEQAVSRIKSLLNGEYFTVSDRELVYVEYTFTSGELVADELGGAPNKFSRYAVYTAR